MFTRVSTLRPRSMLHRHPGVSVCLDGGKSGHQGDDSSSCHLLLPAGILFREA